jgi:hypothetical protein
VILQSEQKEIWRKTDEMERGTGHFVSGACWIGKWKYFDFFANLLIT